MTEKCKIVLHPDYKKHITAFGHPESPMRYEAINELLHNNLLTTPSKVIQPQKAHLSTVALCHTEAYIDLVAEDVKNQSLTLQTGDVSICKDSLDIALLAVGGATAAVDEIFSNKTTRVFCSSRPPGHHATSSKGMGFCIFNNAAIAARYAQKKYGIKRVAIIDWDVHHGNGTQEIFWSDPSVFYFSTHQYGIYPRTGHEQEVGVGNICNIPIYPNEDAKRIIIEVFKDRLTLLMETFRPEFIIISAGFDAHRDDPLGQMNLDEEAYEQLTLSVIKIAEAHCGGKILSILEGGYNCQALARSVYAHIKKLSV